MGLFNWFRRDSGPSAPGRPDDAYRALLERPDPGMAPWFATDTSLISDAGPVRSNNEDYLLAMSQPIAGLATERTCLVALADGMGGHLAGETASRIAVETSINLHRQPSSSNTARRLLSALEHANLSVYEHAQTSAEFEGMGTTLVLLALTDAGAYCAWVGDSRLYRWRGGQLEQLTRDDTLVRELLEQGIIQAHEAQGHPDRSVLSQALGTKPSLRRLNLIGPIDMVVGDCFMMCSDGLHDVVPEERLAEVLAIDDSRAACQELLRQAVLHHADDNISAAVIRIGALEAQRQSLRRTAITNIDES